VHKVSLIQERKAFKSLVR